LLIDCENIADLTSIAEQKAHGVHLTHLDCPWAFMNAKGLEPPSWSLADKLIGNVYAGMLVPAFAGAAKDKGTNLVLWKWGATRPHLVEAHDPDGDLPSDQSSWKGP
jgi:RES domain-containing protein